MDLIDGSRLRRFGYWPSATIDRMRPPMTADGVVQIHSLVVPSRRSSMRTCGINRRYGRQNPSSAERPTQCHERQREPVQRARQAFVGKAFEGWQHGDEGLRAGINVEDKA